MSSQFMITAKSGHTRGSSWVVDQKVLTIGRSYRCDIVVDDGTVSRQHCRVAKVLEGIRLEDLGSRNPALVAGIPQTDATLKAGDEFSVGRAVFLVTSVTPVEVPRAPRIHDSDTISVEVDDLDLNSQEQHGVWPNTSVDYVLLFRFCRICSHLKTEVKLAEQMEEMLGGRMGACSVNFIFDEDLGNGIDVALGDTCVSPLHTDTVDKVIEQRRAMSLVVAPNDNDIKYLFVSPIFNIGAPPAMVLLTMGDIVDTMDRESALTLFSAACEVVGPYVHAARKYEDLLELNMRLSASVVNEANPLVGQSVEMKRLRTAIMDAAPTPLNVLITGETGTGKELVAQAIHRNSPRADKPYRVMNCAAVPPNLFESELFGYEKGAFTGATSAKQGLLSVVDGGILFLDEVADLSAENQARILRVLEQGTYQSVGSTEERFVDVRFIAATNRPVEGPDFRNDLFHRLAGFVLNTPPLRDRPEDIAPLGQHFLDQCAVIDERLIHILSDDAVEALSRYHWPGNVRELQSSMSRIAHRTPTALITAEDIWRDGRIEVSPTRSEGPLPTMAEVERNHILKVLRTCNGNRSKSARVLQISRSTLYLKLEQYDLTEEE